MHLDPGLRDLREPSLVERADGSLRLAFIARADGQARASVWVAELSPLRPAP